jgi:hypothetical protein
MKNRISFIKGLPSVFKGKKYECFENTSEVQGKAYLKLKEGYQGLSILSLDPAETNYERA